MPLSKSTGQMYEWVTHTWSCLNGECTHGCQYCYIKTGHYTKDSPNYKGEPRFNENDANINLGSGRTIFVGHTGDLGAMGESVIERVLSICRKYPDNKYILQTKAPLKLLSFDLPKNSVVGTTIETDDMEMLKSLSSAPSPRDRAMGLASFKTYYDDVSTFLTVEPIMKFDLCKLMDLIDTANPDWINIGADSKGCKLVEPTWDSVQQLIGALTYEGVHIKEKSNLDRLRVL